MTRIRTIFLAMRDRRMFQTLVIYAGAAWVIVEVTDFAVSNYDLSRKPLELVVFHLVLGLPAAMVVAWFHGERPQAAPVPGG